MYPRSIHCVGAVLYSVIALLSAAACAQGVGGKAGIGGKGGYGGGFTSSAPTNAQTPCGNYVQFGSSVSCTLGSSPTSGHQVFVAAVNTGSATNSFTSPTGCSGYSWTLVTTTAPSGASASLWRATANGNACAPATTATAATLLIEAWDVQNFTALDSGTPVFYANFCASPCTANAITTHTSNSLVNFGLFSGSTVTLTSIGGGFTLNLNTSYGSGTGVTGAAYDAAASTGTFTPTYVTSATNQWYELTFAVH